LSVRSAICEASISPISSQTDRVALSTKCGAGSWQAIIPHSRRSTTIETVIDEPTPMFLRYSMCTGEALRRAERVRSSGLPVNGPTSGTIGTGAETTLAIRRR
jgi:hypothetical protein